MTKIKRIVLPFLVLALIFSVCGCGKEETASVADTFSVPENYAFVVTVTINPEIELYLDSSNTIIGVHFLNKDAEAAYSELKLSGATLDNGLSEIVKTAIEKEYLKTDADITVEVEETKNETVNAEALLAVSQSAIEKTLAEKSFTAHVVTKVNDKVKTDDASKPADTPSEPADSAEVCPGCGGSGKCSACKGGTIACPACNGTGLEICTNCDESGMQKCPNSHSCKNGKCDCPNCNATGKENCSACGGTGNDPNNPGDDCLVCNGTGSLNCPICKGNGYEICKHCNGAGKIACEICKGTHSWSCSHCKGTKTAKDCPECGGSFLCHECGGTGVK